MAEGGSPGRGRAERSKPETFNFLGVERRTVFRFEEQEEVLIYRQGQRVILEPKKRAWSSKFLDLAGSAPDFPYPDDPPPAEPGPDLD